MTTLATQPATILVVDDTPTNRMMLEHHLLRLGHRVVSAEHGYDALELLRTQTVDLIMLDIMMPVMDGFETLAVLKADPVLMHLPVIIISSLDDVASVARGITLGAEDFLFKPIERVLLDARVQACLVRKRLYDREQAAAQAAVAANRAKDAFVSMVSHELRNPITGIMGYADLLLLETLGPINQAQTESIQTIGSLVRMMSRLLADLTDLSKIEAGHLHLELAPTCLTKEVATASNSVRKLIEDKQHHLTIDIPYDLPCVLVDRIRLIQILTNLLSNAAKYTLRGGNITLTARLLSPSVIQVSIRDNGIGIPAQEQERIFEPFFRTSDARDGTTPGTGLGLNITRNLVEIQGGQIWFTSKPGEGTTFFFTLPVVEPVPCSVETPRHLASYSYSNA